jgi:hypothetical protein
MPRSTQFFLTLLTVNFFLFSNVFASSKEFFILAKVNQSVITNYDLSKKIAFMQIVIPTFGKLKTEDQNQYAMQSLIQDELRYDYAKKINFQLDDKQKAEYINLVILDFSKIKTIKNIKNFALNYGNFIESEALWRAIIEKNIRPKVQISQEMVDEVFKKYQGRKLSKDEITQMLIDEQIQLQSQQILESVRRAGIIEFMQ